MLRRVEERKCILTRSKNRYWINVIGQIHAPAPSFPRESRLSPLDRNPRDSDGGTTYL